MSPSTGSFPGDGIARRRPRLLLLIPCLLVACLTLLPGCGKDDVTRPQPGFSEAPPYLGDWKAYTGRAEFSGVQTLVALPSGEFLAHDTSADRVIRIGPGGARLGSWPTVTDSSDGLPADLYDMRLGLDGWLYFQETRCSSVSGPGPIALPQPVPVPADRCHQAIVRFAPDGRFLGRLPIFGDDSLHAQSYLSDYAVNAAGELYALEAPYDSRPRVLRFDASGEPLGQWGGRGDADGEFESPRDIEAAPDGSVLVADDDLYSIQRFDAQGRFLSRVLDEDSGGGLRFPAFKIAPDGTLYLLGLSGHGFERFSLDGAPLGSLTLHLSADDPRVYPVFDVLRTVAIDAAGALLLVDSEGALSHFSAAGVRDYQVGATAVRGPTDFTSLKSLARAPGGGVLGLMDNPSRLLRFGPDGSTSEWSTPASPSALLYTAMATDERGRIYLLDPRANAVVELRSDGTVAGTIVLPLILSDVVDAASVLAAGPDGTFFIGLGFYPSQIAVISAGGELLGRVRHSGDPVDDLQTARDLAVGPAGDVWVLLGGVSYVYPGPAVIRRPRLESYAADGALRATIPLDSAAVGVVLTPRSFAFDAEGHFVVAATTETGGLVLVLDERGRVLARWGEELTGDARFAYPSRVVVDEADRIYIYDAGQSRLLRFGPRRAGAAEAGS